MSNSGRPTVYRQEVAIMDASEVIMSNTAPFGPIGELLDRSLSIRHVYGEPVKHNEMTVIPVAQVLYGFGAGGGRGPGGYRSSKPGEARSGENGAPEAEGAGGGGGVRMAPVGALEIGPHGTRFVRFHPLAPWVGGSALGVVVRWLLARLRR
jgi:uncharacterized spore protein YtfJ